jgi:transcriptional regulator with XRE-family HTH domain
MKLQDLENRLRRHIRTRIERGELTGVGLSRKAGFQQPHLSNFLNGRRGLSLEAMDRLLRSLHIDLVELIERRDLERRLPSSAGTQEWEPVAVLPLVRAARLPHFTARQMAETRSFRRDFLGQLRPDDICNRRHWLRFVAVRLGPPASHSLFPQADGGVTLLIDRHYNSLRPYRRPEPNLYLVRTGGRCFVSQASLAEGRLVLRPRDPRLPVEIAPLERRDRYADYIIGRVCYAEFEM